MANLQITLERLNSLSPFKIANDEAVRDKFISIWNALWGEDTGEAAYEREARHFNGLLRDNPDLQSCTKFSIFTAFIDLAVAGLSLEPGTRALAYLLSRGYKSGQKTQDGKDIYEQRVTLTVSAYGELVMRVRCGQIRHADNPVLVYEGDEFSFSDRGGRKEVDYVCHLPHNGKRIIACYIRITRADGSIDYSVMTEEDWERLANYSAKNNSYYDTQQRKRVNGRPNALYGMDAEGVCDIDPGFLSAKCIKHAFKTYPKIRIGRGTELETQQVEEKEIEINNELYGVADPNDTAAQEEAAKPFGNPEPQTGVTVDPGDDDAF